MKKLLIDTSIELTKAVKLFEKETEDKLYEMFEDMNAHAKAFEKKVWPSITEIDDEIAELTAKREAIMEPLDEYVREKKDEMCQYETERDLEILDDRTLLEEVNTEIEKQLKTEGVPLQSNYVLHGSDGGHIAVTHLTKRKTVVHDLQGLIDAIGVDKYLTICRHTPSITRMHKALSIRDKARFTRMVMVKNEVHIKTHA